MKKFQISTLRNMTGADNELGVEWVTKEQDRQHTIVAASATRRGGGTLDQCA